MKSPISRDAPTRRGLLTAMLAIALAPASLRAQGLNVVYEPTPHETVERMLNAANVRGEDFVIDLGSGDGRIPIAAARRGARAVGIDIDPRRIAEARENARKAGVEKRVRFIQADLFEQDLSAATVITLYLLPQLNLRLRPTLLALAPGTRIVSHGFDMGDWRPDRTITAGGSLVHFWRVPPRTT
jgi:tRNA G37 N-methylase Trm5